MLRVFSVVARTLVLALLAAPISAAHLRVIDSRVDQLSEGPAATLDFRAPTIGSRAPEDYGAAVGTGASQNLEADDSPACNFAMIRITSTYVVEPDEGEVSGACVRIRFCHRGEFSVTRSGSNMGAQAGVGGVNIYAVCSLAPVYGQISFPGAGQLVHDPSGAATVLSSYGPSVISADAAPDSFENCGEISARIGDELSVDIAAGSSTWGTPVGTASASSSQSINIETHACPIQEIPALSPIGLGLLSLGLGGLGLWMARRRGVRTA